MKRCCATAGAATSINRVTERDVNVRMHPIGRHALSTRQRFWDKRSRAGMESLSPAIRHDPRKRLVHDLPLSIQLEEIEVVDELDRAIVELHLDDCSRSRLIDAEYSLFGRGVVRPRRFYRRSKLLRSGCSTCRRPSPGTAWLQDERPFGCGTRPLSPCPEDSDRSSCGSPDRQDSAPRARRHTTVPLSPVHTHFSRFDSSACQSPIRRPSVL